MIRHVLMLASLTLAVPAAAQEARCKDDRGQERCTTAAEAKQNALYGVPAIDDPTLRTSRTIRAFFVDGYGNDIGMIAFSRPDGSDPGVVWRAPGSADGKRPGRSMTAPVPLATWDTLVADGRYFERSFAPRATGSWNDAPICLHSWVVRVEAVDADGTLRRRTQDMCGDDTIAGRYGFSVAATAVATFPYCALLDLAKTRNNVTRLFDCSQLSGDRPAAAAAWNRYRSDWFANPRGPDFARAIAYLFYDSAEVSWPGKGTVTGMTAAAQLWAASAGDTHFFIERVVGDTPDRVRIEGRMRDLRPPEGDTTPRPFTMVWTRENGFDFRLRRFTTG